MVNINDVYQLLNDFANKDQSSGTITPVVFNRFAPKAQLEIIDSFLNNPRAYAQAENQQPRKGYESSQAIIDIFSDLKVKTNLTVDLDGYIEEPEDYKYFSSGRASFIVERFTGEKEVVKSGVRVLRDNEISDVSSSEIDFATQLHPCIAFFKGKWEVFPKEVQSLELTYLREPKKPVWDSALVNEVPVYEPNGSQDFELPSSLKSDLVYKLCQYTGVRMREDYLQQVSTYLKNQDEI